MRLIAIVAVAAAFATTTPADAAPHAFLNPQPLPPICAYATFTRDRFPMLAKLLATIGLPPPSPCRH